MEEKKEDLLNDIKNLTSKIIKYIENDMFQVVGIHLEFKSDDYWYHIKINNEIYLDIIVNDNYKTAKTLNSWFNFNENQQKELYKKLVGGGYTFQIDELIYQKNHIENRIKLLEQFKNKVIS